MEAFNYSSFPQFKDEPIYNDQDIANFIEDLNQIPDSSAYEKFLQKFQHGFFSKYKTFHQNRPSQFPFGGASKPAYQDYSYNPNSPRPRSVSNGRTLNETRPYEEPYPPLSRSIYSNATFDQSNRMRTPGKRRPDPFMADDYPREEPRRYEFGTQDFGRGREFVRDLPRERDYRDYYHERPYNDPYAASYNAPPRQMPLRGYYAPTEPTASYTPEFYRAERGYYPPDPQIVPPTSNRNPLIESMELRRLKEQFLLNASQPNQFGEVRSGMPERRYW